MDSGILYVSDLDGTLLNTRDRISPYSLNVINTLIEKGMKFTYATARSLVSASRVAEGLTLHIPVIVYNGAFIMEADTGKILYSAKMAEKESRFLEEYFNRAGLFPLVYTFREGQEKYAGILPVKIMGSNGIFPCAKTTEGWSLWRTMRAFIRGKCFILPV